MCLHMYIKNISLVSIVFSEDVFTLTCGIPGVGSIASIAVHINGDDGWQLEWVDIANGLETIRINCGHLMDDHETRRFYGN